MTDPNQLLIENTLLRGELKLALLALDRYASTPHSKPDAKGRVTVKVPEEAQGKALDAIKRGQARLNERDEGRSL